MTHDPPTSLPSRSPPRCKTTGSPKYNRVTWTPPFPNIMATLGVFACARFPVWPTSSSLALDSASTETGRGKPPKPPGDAVLHDGREQFTNARSGWGQLQTCTPCSSSIFSQWRGSDFQLSLCSIRPSAMSRKVPYSLKVSSSWNRIVVACVQLLELHPRPTCTRVMEMHDRLRLEVN